MRSPKLRADRSDAALPPKLDAHVGDLGYALLLKRIRPDIENATPAEIDAGGALAPFPTCRCCSGRSASWSGSASISSRCSRVAFYLSAERSSSTAAGSCGWRCGACRCPGSRRSSAGSSPNTAASPGSSTASCRPSSASLERAGRQCRGSACCGFVLFYTALAVVDVYLMVKYIRLGPDAHDARRAVGAAPSARVADGGATPCSITKPCASSGGRCSASC